MTTSIELPSGKILNIARFIALLPVTNTADSSYHLILEGYPHHINLESSDAQALKKLLELDRDNTASTNQSGWDQEKQLQKNQRAMELLAKQMEHDENISDSEAMERQEFFERFKQIVDAERPEGQKLYSES
jgi:Skp family chaperone for outer membrane proteins